MPITLGAGQTKRLDASLTPVYVPPVLATLYGTVIDVETHIPISGVLVEVIGTGLTTSTDTGGSYEIAYIPPGTYTIRFSHPDYGTKEV